MNFRWILSGELESGHCEDQEQQIVILRHACQQLDLASGQQQGTEEADGKINDAVSRENSVAIPLQNKNRTTCHPASPLLDIYPKNTKTLVREDTCTLAFSIIYNSEEMEAACFH